MTSAHTIDELITKVSETMRSHLTRLQSDYDIYKQTHDAILALPAVQSAIREGYSPHQESKSEKEKQSYFTSTNMYIETIDALKSELRNVQLENDALRLQLSSSSESTSNITLVIEETTTLQQEPFEAEEEEVNEDKEEEEADVQEEDAEEADVQEEDAEEAEEADVQEEDAEEAEAVDVQEEYVEADAANEEDAEEADVQEDEDEDEEEDEEEVEVVEVQIKGKTYFATNEISGVIYECLADGDIGDEVGEFKNGKPVFKSTR